MVWSQKKRDNEEHTLPCFVFFCSFLVIKFKRRSSTVRSWGCCNFLPKKYLPLHGKDRMMATPPLWHSTSTKGKKGLTLCSSSLCKVSFQRIVALWNCRLAAWPVALSTVKLVTGYLQHALQSSYLLCDCMPAPLMKNCTQLLQSYVCDAAQLLQNGNISDTRVFCCFVQGFSCSKNCSEI